MSSGVIEDWNRPNATPRSRKYPTARTLWPVGQYAVDFEELPGTLARAARWHSRLAVAEFVSEDYFDLMRAAISVGTAAELLAKTYLARNAPALLADRGDRDSLLMLQDLPAGTHGPLGFRSVTALEALKLVKHLVPNLPLTPSDVNPLEARNAAAHMGFVDVHHLRDAVVQYCRLAAVMLDALELATEPFWGPDLAATAASLVEEAKTEAARMVAAKLAAARVRVAARVAGLDGQARAAVLAALSGVQLTSADHDEPSTCPACEQRGRLLCIVERGPVEFEVDGAIVQRSAIPVEFECAVCELHLEGDELDEVASFPEYFQLDPDTDPPEAEGWEPDEDWMRGR